MYLFNRLTLESAVEIDEKIKAEIVNSVVERYNINRDEIETDETEYKFDFDEGVSVIIVFNSCNELEIQSNYSDVVVELYNAIGNTIWSLSCKDREII